MNGAMLKTRAIKTNWATRNQNQKRGLNTFFYFKELTLILQKIIFGKNGLYILVCKFFE